MKTSLCHVCRPLIALAAIFVVSSAREVSACSTMTPTSGACAKACGCCTPKTSEPSAVREDSVPRFLVFAAVPITTKTTEVEGCSCRAPEPAAPSPKPSSSSFQSRTEPGQSLDYARHGDEAVTRDLPASGVLLWQIAPKIPLYLRNSRLLF